MIRTAKGFCAAALLALLSSASFAAEKPYYHPDVAADATRLQGALKKLWPAAGKSVAQWRRLADQMVKAGDARASIGDFGATLALEPQDAKSWLALARALEVPSP